MTMLSDVQEAQIAAVRAAFGDGLRRVEGFGADDLAVAMQQLVLQIPSALCVLGGVTYEPISVATAVKVRAKATWLWIFFAKNYRGDKASREGDADSFGAFAIIEQLRNALLGQDFGLSIKRLMPVELRLQPPSEGLRAVIYHYVWRTEWTETQPDTAANVADLVQIHSALTDGTAEEDGLTVLPDPATP